MIELDCVMDTLERRLVDNWVGPPISWVFQNSDDMPNRPYIVIQTDKIDERDATIDGNGRRIFLRFRATVVTERGSYNRDGIRIAQAIQPLFPHGKRFDIEGAEIIVTSHLKIEDGYADGFDWRVPAVLEIEVHNA